MWNKLTIKNSLWPSNFTSGNISLKRCQNCKHLSISENFSHCNHLTIQKMKINSGKCCALIQQIMWPSVNNYQKNHNDKRKRLLGYWVKKVGSKSISSIISYMLNCVLKTDRDFPAGGTGSITGQGTQILPPPKK